MSNNKYPINYNLFETGYGNDYPIFFADSLSSGIA